MCQCVPFCPTDSTAMVHFQGLSLWTMFSELFQGDRIMWKKHDKQTTKFVLLCFKNLLYMLIVIPVCVGRPFYENLIQQECWLEQRTLLGKSVLLSYRNNFLSNMDWSHFLSLLLIGWCTCIVPSAWNMRCLVWICLYSCRGLFCHSREHEFWGCCCNSY